MHPGTVRQTQWLDPFNGDRRCHPWLREQDMPKKWVIFTFSVKCKSREFIQKLKKHYCALFWRVRVYRVAKKKQFCKTYGPLCAKLYNLTVRSIQYKHVHTRHCKHLSFLIFEP